MRSAVAAWTAALLPLVLTQKVSFSATSDLEFYTGTQSHSSSTSKPPPSSAYISYASRITITGANNDNEVTTVTFTDFGTPLSTGTPESSSTSENATQSTTAAKPKNTQPCNNYVELCTKKYGNITNVGAHNSPFVRPGNSGSNQALDVSNQLDDGIRFLQAQIQWPVNGTVPHFCHTSCDLLDAGPITDWLTQVRKWVDKHPYDVVTILLGNGNYSKPELYAPYIESTGITKYTYEAPYLPMKRSDWPTLEYLILRGKRVLMFLDYEADQEKYPWLMNEFSQWWETPFDPTDDAFPCTVQRPPDLKKKDAQERLYIMNHNLNVEFDVFGVELLVPAVSMLNTTNGVEGPGSLGMAANNCRSDWDVKPNVLNVDYYNYGSYEGSVFEVAAMLNNVTYDKGDCCGKVSAGQRVSPGVIWVGWVFVALFCSLAL